MATDEQQTALERAGPGRVMAYMFLLGMFATLAQVLFLREMLVVFFGNELVIGCMLAGWFLGIGLGAFSARFMPRWLAESLTSERLLSVLMFLMAVALPVQIYAVRIVRELLHVPIGEYVSLGRIVSSSFLIFLPASFGIGMVFPVASELVSRSDDNASSGAATPVSRIYAWESFGSMIGGMVLTWLLMAMFSPLRIVLAAMSIGSAAAAVISTRREMRTAPALLMVCTVLLAPLYPGLVDNIERRVVERQWQAFGVLQSGHDRQSSQDSRIVRSENSVYQNLTVTESVGQFTLYSNGRVMFVFPDPIGYEHSIHFIMVQNPSAKRVLLIGGNPLGDIPELLKYPLERLVCVELDSVIGSLLSQIKPVEYEALKKDRRVTFIQQDPPRFVQGCRDQFDVVIVNAPEPSTAAANRYYTLEFYRNIRRILAPDGFVCTSLSSSERLQAEAAELGASVYRTIMHVFPEIRVTAETQNRFFAGSRTAGLTFDRRVLHDRSRKAAVNNRFFRPEYFLGADEIDPDKTRAVAEKFLTANIRLNTNMRPSTYFYNLVLWSRCSGSGVEALLSKIRLMDCRRAMGWAIACGLVLLSGGLLLRGTRGIRSETCPVDDAWVRALAVALIATTGFCGMALELVLIFVFQGLYGYVYSMIGLIVAVFMFGLVLGAPSGKLMAGQGRLGFWLSIALVQVLLLVCALAVPGLAGVAAGVSGAAGLVFEIAIYVLAGIVGWTVGAEFPLVNRLYSEAGGSVRTSAAVTDAADHLGAAVGAVLAGVFLVPVLGLEDSCNFIAAVVCLGLLCIVAAIVSSRREEGDKRFT